MRSFLSFLKESKNSVSVDVFHGTGKKIEKFDSRLARTRNDFFGSGEGYFTDSHEISKSYAKSSGKKTGSAYVIHTNLNMSNVFDVDHHFEGDSLKRLLPKDTETFAKHAGLLNLGNMEDKYSILGNLESGRTRLTGKQVFWGLSHGGTKTEVARKHLIKKGYDGLRYNGGENMQGAIRHNVYIPYNSSSIKIKKTEKL